MQDIADAKIRGYLQKACDTTAAAERSQAVKLLLSTESAQRTLHVLPTQGAIDTLLTL